MRADVLRKNLFDQEETYKILRRAQEIVIEMKCPNLQYLLFNTFETHKTKDFFICQELLNGKSFCEICLSVPSEIAKALKYYDKDHFDIENSIVQELAKGDRMRFEALRDINFYPKN